MAVGCGGGGKKLNLALAKICTMYIYLWMLLDGVISGKIYTVFFLLHLLGVFGTIHITYMNIFHYSNLLLAGRAIKKHPELKYETLNLSQRWTVEFWGALCGGTMWGLIAAAGSGWHRWSPSLIREQSPWMGEISGIISITEMENEEEQYAVERYEWR